MSVNSLPKTVTRQRRDCDLNPGSSAPESSTLTTRLPRQPLVLLAHLKARLDKFWLHQAVKCDFTADLTGTGNISEEVTE